MVRITQFCSGSGSSLLLNFIEKLRFDSSCLGCVMFNGMDEGLLQNILDALETVPS